jgi:hypothetical protein
MLHYIGYLMFHLNHSLFNSWGVYQQIYVLYEPNNEPNGSFKKLLFLVVNKFIALFVPLLLGSLLDNLSNKSNSFYVHINDKNLYVSYGLVKVGYTLVFHFDGSTSAVFTF